MSGAPAGSRLLELLVQEGSWGEGLPHPASSLSEGFQGSGWMTAPTKSQALGSLERQPVSSQQCCPLGTEAAATPKLPGRALAEPGAPGVRPPQQAGVGAAVLGPWGLAPSFLLLWGHGLTGSSRSLLRSQALWECGLHQVRPVGPTRSALDPSSPLPRASGLKPPPTVHPSPELLPPSSFAPCGAQVHVWVRPPGPVLAWPLLLLSRTLGAVAKAVLTASGDAPSVGATVLGTQQGAAPEAPAHDTYMEVETKGHPTRTEAEAADQGGPCRPQGEAGR